MGDVYYFTFSNYAFIFLLVKAIIDYIDHYFC